MATGSGEAVSLEAILRGVEDTGLPLAGPRYLTSAALVALGEPMQLSHVGTILRFVKPDAVIPRESPTSEAS